MKVGKEFQRSWIIANAVFTAIGIAMGAFHYPLESDSSCLGIFCDGYGFGLGAMTGAVVGFGQWYLLEPLFNPRNSMARVERRKARILSWWLIVTSLGYAIGHALGDTPILPVNELPYSAILYGVVSGLIIGTLQWLVIRQHAANSAWWIVGAVIGFACGLTVTGLLYYAVSDAGGDPIAAINSPFTLPVVGILQGLILGSFFAAATLWSLRRITPRERLVKSNVG